MFLKLNSFILADLLVCMPALGGRIKVEIVGCWKLSRPCMLATPTSAKANLKKSNLQHEMTMTSNHDMSRYDLIHSDRHHRYSIICFWITVITASITVTAVIVFRSNKATHLLNSILGICVGYVCLIYACYMCLLLNASSKAIHEKKLERQDLLCGLVRCTQNMRRFADLNLSPGW